MNARSMPLWTRRAFDFSATEGTTAVPACLDVDLGGFRWGALMLRVHARTIDPACTVTVRLQRRAPTPCDPGTEFEGDADLVTAVLDGAVAAPSLLRFPLGVTFGPFVTAIVEGRVAASSAAIAVLSAGLVLR